MRALTAAVEVRVTLGKTLQGAQWQEQDSRWMTKMVAWAVGMVLILQNKHAAEIEEQNINGTKCLALQTQTNNNIEIIQWKG